MTNLPEYEELLQALEFSRLGYWKWHSAGGAVTLSKRAAEVFGLPHEAPVSWPELRDLIVEPDRDVVVDHIQRAMDDRTDYEVEFRINRASDRKPSRVLARGRARFDSAGIMSISGIIEDVTERSRRDATLEEERRSLEILNRTGALIGANLDLEKLVQAVTDAAVELTHAKYGAFFYNVTNASGKSYMLYTLSGVSRDAFAGFPMPRKTAIFAPTFDGEGIVRSDDIQQDPRYGKNSPHQGMPHGHLPLRSYLAAPVVSRTGEVIGGLFFGHPETGIFDARAEAIIAGIAAQASVAIDNSRLFKTAQDERERYRQLVETLPQLVWTCHPNGECSHLSRQWIEFTGIPEVEQLGFSWLERVIHPDDRSRVFEHWLGAVRGEHDYDIDFRIRRYDGEYRWFKTRATPIRDGEYTIQWFGTCTDIEDIVEAREMQAAMRERLEAEVEKRTRELEQTNAVLKQESLNRQSAEGKFKLIVESVTDYAIFMLDANGYVTNWNPGAERIKGYLASEIIGQHMSTFYPADDRASGIPLAALETARSRGKFEAEGQRIRKDGSTFWASVIINAIRDENGELIGFAKITRDISERKQAEEALQRAQEQLAQSQKMEGIGQLTGGIAHDFNNLLTIILGNLDTLGRLLIDETADRSRLLRSQENAARGAQRAASLTQRLLAFSRRQPLDPKPTDIGRLVTGMSDLLRRSLGEQISVETVLAGGLWRVLVDTNQLEIAILNLAVNARDAMQKGGKLTIETANSYLDEGYAAGQAEVVPGQYVLICLSDTGTGMSKDTIARAFEPFFTTKDVGHGTGLGLSQVYGFVKQSGGHVKIYSEVGHGTTVKIYLPRIRGDVAADTTSPSPSKPVRGSETVLLVEDEEDVRAYSKEIVSELGYNVIDAQDGRSALENLAAHPEIKLLFTDVGLPGGMNGRQLAEEARRRRPDLKVLFTTGYARNAIVHDGRLDPGVQLITKPFTYAALASKLRDVLDSVTRKPTILLVEDELLIQMMATETLESAGYNVEVAATAAEALDKIRLVQGADLAIVDIGLPDRKGNVLVSELRALYPNLPVIIASGYGAAEVKDQFADDAQTVFLNKPYVDRDLIALAHRVLKRS